MFPMSSVPGRPVGRRRSPSAPVYTSVPPPLSLRPYLWHRRAKAASLLVNQQQNTFFSRQIRTGPSIRHGLKVRDDGRNMGGKQLEGRRRDFSEPGERRELHGQGATAMSGCLSPSKGHHVSGAYTSALARRASDKSVLL